MNNQRKQSNSGSKSATSFSLQVFIVGVILSVTFFLLLLASFKTYRSTITIIVNAKSEIASQNESEIIGNVLEIPKTLAFYERLLKNNTDVRDVTIGKSPDQRKSAWNKMIDIEQVGGNSSLINISITSNEENDANALVKKTSRTLFDSVSQYYDIKKDVDMRIIDGPISRPIFSYWYVALILSVLAGFSFALLLQSLLFNFKNLFTKHVEFKNIFSNINNDERTSAVENELKDEQLIAKYSEDLTAKLSDSAEMEALNKIIEQDMYPNFPEMPVSSAPKSSAPDNLPIGDDTFFAQMPAAEKPEEEKIDPEEIEEEEKTHEPTPEELKKRLNQLLRGEL